MCLILFSYKHHPNYRLILAANRDEFYDRPSAPLLFWREHPHVLAGRDLKSLGTWMGITTSGRFAAITNYRDTKVHKPEAPSRGHLISRFLKTDQSPATYIDEIQSDAGNYNGFNLLVGDTRDMMYYSNRGDRAVHLGPGIFGLSNQLLDTPWPKVKKGRQTLMELTASNSDISHEGLLELLQNQTTPPDEELPDTGVGRAWERILSPIFISSPGYGTRCSTILTIDHSNHVKITEYTWRQDMPKPELAQESTFEFVIGADKG